MGGLASAGPPFVRQRTAHDAFATASPAWSCRSLSRGAGRRRRLPRFGRDCAWYAVFAGALILGLARWLQLRQALRRWQSRAARRRRSRKAARRSPRPRAVPPPWYGRSASPRQG